MTILLGLILSILFAASVSGSPTAGGQGAVDQGAADDEGSGGSDLPEPWRSRLEDVSGKLRAEDWPAARSSAEELVRNMAELFTASEAGRGLVAAALSLQAVAEAGAGQYDDALWHWQVAQNLNPRLRGMAMPKGQGLEDEALWSWHLLPSFHRDPDAIMAEYPVSLRRFFEEHPIRCAPRPEKHPDCRALDLAEHPEVHPPRWASSPLALPASLVKRMEGDRLVASIVVDSEGRVREPHMLAGHSTAAGFFALQALREWTFEPAVRDGEPVDVLMEVSIPLVAEASAQVRERWRGNLDGLDARLLEGDWQGVFDESRGLVARIAGGIGGGGSDLLARGLTQLALAEAGLGHDDDAIWHWSMAQNLAVEYRYMDLSAYAAAGELLAGQRLRRFGESETRDGEAPRRVSAPEARFPDRFPEVEDVGSFELILDEAGRPRAPLVLRGRSPSRLYAALEALREWRYEPSTAVGPRRRVETFLLAQRAPMRDLEVVPEVYQLAQAALTRARSEPVIAGCYWKAARDLAPVLLRADLSSKGPAAEALNEVVPPRDRWNHQNARVRSATYVGGEVRPPVKISSPMPQYTSKTHRQRIQGVVITQVIIDKQGQVVNLKVLQGLHLELDIQAIKAICTWRFEPATLNGEPVDVYYNLTTNFRLR